MKHHDREEQSEHTESERTSRMSVHLSECLPWREGRGMPFQGDRINYLKVSRWDREGLLLKPGMPSPHMVFGHLQPGQFPESEGQAGRLTVKSWLWQPQGKSHRSAEPQFRRQ